MGRIIIIVMGLAIAFPAWANNVVAVTVGTSSAQALAAPDITYHMLAIDNESATNTIACSFGGTAGINTAGSYTIAPGLTRVWGRSGWSTNQAINCISSAPSTPVTVEYQ